MTRQLKVNAHWELAGINAVVDGARVDVDSVSVVVLERVGVRPPHPNGVLQGDFAFSIRNPSPFVRRALAVGAVFELGMGKGR